MSLGVLAQSIEPAVRQGEAETLVITGTFTTTPVAWAVALWMRLTPQDDWTVFTSGITVSVSGNYIGVWTIPLSAADTDSLDAGLVTFQFMRTDSGYETVLAAGTQLVIEGGST